MAIKKIIELLNFYHSIDRRDELSTIEKEQTRQLIRRNVKQLSKYIGQDSLSDISRAYKDVELLAELRERYF